LFVYSWRCRLFSFTIDAAAMPPVRTPLTQHDLLSAAWEQSTSRSYSHAFYAFRRFCQETGHTIALSQDMLEAFVVWLANRYAPATIKNYLSGLRAQYILLGVVDDFDSLRRGPVVRLMIRGAQKIRARAGIEPRRAPALSVRQLTDCRIACNLDQYDDALLWAIIATATFGLLRLGELTNPDPRKVPQRESVDVISHRLAQLRLPYSKTDAFFEGSTITLATPRGQLVGLCPVHALSAFIRHRDRISALPNRLFVLADGTAPTRTWVVCRVRRILSDQAIQGHSFRATGATCLALSGASRLTIMVAGRWTSDAFLRYLRKHPDVERSLVSATHTLASPLGSRSAGNPRNGGSPVRARDGDRSA
jgi:hypothetical protein